MKEKPDEIVKMIKAVLRATDYIRTRKNDVLAFLDAKWGIKEADVRRASTGTWWISSAVMGSPRTRP
jgi:ABC-type nitrate/sulfonate/bicarbonate transport system substrate-binding protein